MKILAEQACPGRHANKHAEKKSRKILKKMAKLEKKLHKYNIEDEVNSDDTLSSDSSGSNRSSRRRNRSRSSSTSSSSSASSSSSSRSASPAEQKHQRRHYRHGHLARSRSLFAGRGCSPVTISREDRRHHRRHHSHHREFHGKPRQHRHHHYFRRCNNIVEGGLFRNLALTDDLHDDRQRKNRQPQVIDVEMVDNLQEIAAVNFDNQVDDAILTGPEIEESLANNWKEIVQNGLTNDKLQELIKKYPVNRKHHGLSLQGPKLNKEIAYIISDIATCKDTSKLALQNEIGIGLSALGQAISSLNNKPELKEDAEITGIIEKLNDAANVLLGTHYSMTTLRQLDVKGEMSRKAQAVLDTCEHDELLFGKDLEEKAKNAKGFEKCKKMWKKEEKIGKRKHNGQEGEKRKSKRWDTPATSH